LSHTPAHVCASIQKFALLYRANAAELREMGHANVRAQGACFHMKLAISGIIQQTEQSNMKSIRQKQSATFFLLTSLAAQNWYGAEEIVVA
jgi:hypothetical protein